MNTRRIRCAGLPATATVTVLVVAGPAPSATAAGALASCLGHRWTGNAGVINVRAIPNGSVNPRFSRSGSIFTLDITHTDTQGRVSHSVPNGCLVP